MLCSAGLLNLNVNKHLRALAIEIQIRGMVALQLTENNISVGQVTNMNVIHRKHHFQ